MASIFISYRRADIPYALLVYDQLCEAFGSAQVFRDIEGISPAEDFVARLDRVLRESRAVVVLVGKGWLRQRHRLFDRNDFVRRELRAALNRRLKIYPLLVGTAKMPAAKELPPVLRPFARLNAIPLTDYRFARDFGDVVMALRSGTRRARIPSPVPAATGVMTATVEELNIRATTLIERGEIAAARAALKEGFQLLMDQRRSHTPDARFQLELAYLHKTVSEALIAAGNHAQASHHIALAASSFTCVLHQAQKGLVSTAELAAALNGLGNVHSLLGESSEAIASYREAVHVLPDYAYAWHDLFLELLLEAKRGHYDPAGMREALQKLRETGLWVDGIGEERVAQFEHELIALEAEHSKPAPVPLVAPRTQHARKAREPRRV